MPIDWVALEVPCRPAFILFCLKRSVIPGLKSMNWYMLEPECRRYIVEHALKWSYYTALPRHLHWTGARAAFDCSAAQLKDLQIPTGFAAMLSRDGQPMWNKVGTWVCLAQPFAPISVHERALRLPTTQGSLRHLGRAAQRLSDLCNVLIAAERPSVDLSDENLAHLQPTSALVRCSMLDLMLAHIDLSEPMLTYMTYHTR